MKTLKPLNLHMRPAHVGLHAGLQAYASFLPFAFPGQRTDQPGPTLNLVIKYWTTSWINTGPLHGLILDYFMD
jgi:hypothetical protein